MLTCSSAIYFRKPIPAERMDATITPERMRVFDESRESGAARENTAMSVASEPAKAKSGTEIQLGTLRPIIDIIMAREAPKAAPEEMPSVYGSASGFSRIA